jgi:hypothetical protein
MPAVERLAATKKCSHGDFLCIVFKLLFEFRQGFLSLPPLGALGADTHWRTRRIPQWLSGKRLFPPVAYQVDQSLSLSGNPCAASKHPEIDRVFAIRKLSPASSRRVVSNLLVVLAAGRRAGPPSDRLRSRFRGLCRTAGSEASHEFRGFPHHRLGIVAMESCRHLLFFFVVLVAVLLCWLLHEGDGKSRLFD